MLFLNDGQQSESRSWIHPFFPYVSFDQSGLSQQQKVTSRVCRWIYVFLHVYHHACGGLKLSLGVFLDYCLLLSLMQNLNPGLTHKPALSGCLHCPSIGITYCCYDHLACYGLWESKCWSSCLQGKHFIHWASSLVPRPHSSHLVALGCGNQHLG